MTRWIPHPLLTLALIVMWLLLTRFSLGHLILGTGIALVAGWALSSLHPAGPRLRRWDKIAQLLGIVFVDIVRSNMAVAWLILTRDRRGTRHSEFLEIPLTLRSHAGLALLSMIVTATPGTAWIEYRPRTGVLLLHVFDLLEDADWRELIQNRYEALLQEIFE